jgi:hypothetical protein
MPSPYHGTCSPGGGTHVRVPPSGAAHATSGAAAGGRGQPVGLALFASPHFTKPASISARCVPSQFAPVST